MFVEGRELIAMVRTCHLVRISIHWQLIGDAQGSTVRQLGHSDT